MAVVLAGIAERAATLANACNVAIWVADEDGNVLGVMGIYVARIHEEVKGRPLYLVRDAAGFAFTRSRGDAALIDAPRARSSA